MKSLLVTLYVILLAVLASATLVEHVQGTEFAEKNIYHSGWFCCLWGMLAIAMLAVIVRRALWRKLPVLLFHGSFLIILGGAMLTSLTSHKGYLHLRPGIEECSFLMEENGKKIALPFSIRLDSFQIKYYPGTEAPADYVSYVTCKQEEGQTKRTECISMNHILQLQGYRFYQSSFDEDKQGSWLTVNYDPYGTAMTYAGYLLLGFSMLGLLLARRGEFRRLLRHPLLRGGGLFLLFSCCLYTTAQAKESFSNTGRVRPLPVLKRIQADSLARKQVIYQDRIVPFNTLARDFLLKLTGKSSYEGLTPEQVIGGWLLRPEAWRREPMIRIKSAELRRLLHMETSYICLADLFDGENYRLQPYWQREQGRESTLAKAILEVDEKVGLLLMLEQGTLIRPLPEDGSIQPLSPPRVEAELLYNRIPFAKLLFIVNLALGLLAFFYLLYKILHHSTSVCQRRKRVCLLNQFFSFMLYAVTLFHLFGYFLRWYISNRIPLSNGYETMLFMALCILLFSVMLYRRFPVMLPFGFLLSGFTLLVAHLGQMNPQITPLIPVLISPWLSVHVSLVMISYALLAFIWLNGVLALCLYGRRGEYNMERLMLLGRLLLYPALFFLGAGIFVGAVWANVSWGRYWAWDPKEVWALITFMVYGAAFHTRSLPLFRKPLFFHIYMVFAFLMVLMTYFGVNYLLGGMHSYGAT